MFKYFKFKGLETRNYESAADFKEEKTITRERRGINVKRLPNST